MLSALLVLCATLTGLHPGSFSRSRVVVDGRELTHSLHVQALSVLETLPVDQDGDRLLDAEELRAGEEEIVWYLSQSYRFFPNDDLDSALRGKLVSFELRVDGDPADPTSHWIEIEHRYDSSRALRRLTVEESLFETSNPQHVEYASVGWVGEEPTDFVFSGEERRRGFEPTGVPRKSVLRSFVELGVEHILSGWDHLLFLLALLAGVRSLRSLLVVITAFTLAHSLTLALAALDVVGLPSRFVELAIALSIVYVAAENLMRVEKRSLWIEALVFGLLHGLGFAGFLSAALRHEDELLMPLLGFNLGVELGQLLVVLPLGIVLHLLARKRGKRSESDEGLVPAALARLLSLAAVVVGLYWFAERAGFLG